MFSTRKKIVPIDECRHTLRRLPGSTWEVMEVDSGGLPVDIPTRPPHSRFGMRLGSLEVTLALVAGLVAGTLLLYA